MQPSLPDTPTRARVGAAAPDPLLARCRWPDLPQPRLQAAREALDFVLTRHDVLGVVLAGSLAHGRGRATSDLDLVVVCRDPADHRYHRRFAGVPVDLFARGLEVLGRRFAREHTEGRPVHAHMLTTGVVVLDLDPAVGVAVREAGEWLRRPSRLPPPGPAERFIVAKHLDDARDALADDPATAKLLLAEAVLALSRHALRQAGAFLPPSRDEIAAVAAVDQGVGERIRRFFLADAVQEKLSLAQEIAVLVMGGAGFFEWSSGPPPIPPQAPGPRGTADGPHPAPAAVRVPPRAGADDVFAPAASAAGHRRALAAIVERLAAAAAADPAVEAVYTVGSFARGDGDLYSDVDLNLVVRREQLTAFRARLPRLLEGAGPLRHTAPLLRGVATIAVYDGFVRLDVHTATRDTAAFPEQMRVLHDPGGVLNGWTRLSAGLSPADLQEVFDSYCIRLYDFHVSQCRRDFIQGTVAAAQLFPHAARGLRAGIDPERAALGSKHLDPLLGPALRARVVAVLDDLRPATLVQGVERLTDLFVEALGRLPADWTRGLNWAFLDALRRGIREHAAAPRS